MAKERVRELESVKSVQPTAKEPAKEREKLFRVKIDGPLAVGMLQVAAASPEAAIDMLMGWFRASLKVVDHG